MANECTTICTLCAGKESPGFYTGCMVKDGHVKDWNCDGEGHLWRALLVNASRWTGIDYPPASGRGIVRRWSFKSPRQLPIFMVWDEHWYNHQVTYASVVFSTAEICSGWLWRRLSWALDYWFKRWIYDNSRCKRCGELSAIYPSNPFKSSTCFDHCEDHDFAYDRDIHQHACINCGMPAPYDYYD